MQINLNASDLWEQPIRRQALGKCKGRFHRTNGMGTGGADADFEDVEDAGGHGGEGVKGEEWMGGEGG
jgi:hypothetical protein